MNKLLKLRDKIINEFYVKDWREVWFFPQFKNIKGVEKVKGYLGTDPIVFLSINPSYGSYPSPADIFYYENLQQQGFANAHLTDLFKVKIKNDEVDETLANKSELARAIKLLNEELEIIKPKLVVAVGKRHKKLYESVIGNKYPVYLIPHYSQRYNDNTKQKQFRSALRAVKVKYEKL
ncbi:MAG: hypothetical protein A3B91_05040 [Candidatus Yanofskybacteria bacterium RIFCSPHIGHO2_02_FULL_41_29]|uniref:Uracil-DNA glycosylase-like domain-containing protein n=2 Tax=Patescibacteria group TaxID=1783273 RepID=A0A1F5NIM1_9BACT|nr:MAG: hypothetical protein A3J19_03185 [Candidatus Daviesbacteria bacterium RIFCSPLOWO2_02_FULL_41_8]OGN00686.1 MAG: hypothetical protein A2650_04040 [Candidatus Yanofskybacteria bacterium RIFCSPHIGHO2_01_FULL_41_53]OGN11661.1 MAG: hypothetical protein A3B91_05040 [Candidatus Yanofskybacteria bacterium RIFCSPHIGHO2_02_FULL_41_29]OGN23421.1 MAG: hypothetical protein A2916_03430 [Candidatus Yanofskybacteria bacterium RIFCSPLOWO2_01_FULL_41_67]